MRCNRATCKDVKTSNAETLESAKAYTDKKLTEIIPPVTSVNSKTGAVALTTDDVPDTAVKSYTTAADKSRLATTSGNNTGDQDLSGLATKSEVSAHTSNTDNPHGTTKAQVGLSNVDNTSDLLKPVSEAQAAINATKANNDDVVKLTGNQSIAGTKTFNNSTIVNGTITALAATLASHVVIKSQLDTKSDFPSANTQVPVRNSAGAQAAITYSVAPAPNTFPLRSANGALQASTAVASDDLVPLAQLQALIPSGGATGITTVLLNNYSLTSLGVLNPTTTVTLNLNTNANWSVDPPGSKTGATVEELIDPSTGRIKDVGDKNTNIIRVVIEYSQSGIGSDGLLTAQLINNYGVVIDQENESINLNGQQELNVRATFRFIVVKTSDNNTGYALRFINGAKALTAWRIVSILRNNNP